jgi:transcriptional regulator ATRX
LNYWYENGGVVIMGYEMYRRLANGFNIKSKKLKAEAYKCLVDPGPDIVGNLNFFLKDVSSINVIS